MRNTNIDALRFVAAVFVISIHIPWSSNLDTEISTGFVAFSRWCVPFFFFLIGYYSGNIEGHTPFKFQYLMRHVQIFVVASLLYLPLRIFESGLNIGVGTLIAGTWFHLWFLGATVVGILTIQLLYNFKLGRIIALLCIGLLAAYWSVSLISELTGKPTYWGPRALVRHLSAIPLIWFGMWWRKNSKLSMPASIGLLVFSLVAQVCEMLVLSNIGVGFRGVQLFLSTLPFVMALVTIAEACDFRLHPKYAKVAADIAPLIYILHPSFIFGLSKLSERSGFSFSDWSMMAAVTFLTIASSLLIYLIWKPLAELLTGVSPASKSGR